MEINDQGHFMNGLKVVFLSVFIYFFGLVNLSFASNMPVNLVGNQGYDLVSYHQESGPVRGDGNHITYYHHVAYIFVSDANKKAFQADPEKYLPAYGGYCAYGVSVGKKIVSDPLAWKIVDGRLYLNLNQSIQKIWSEDMSGYITKANKLWPAIESSSPENL